jgi:hypothetical protein
VVVDLIGHAILVIPFRVSENAMIRARVTSFDTSIIVSRAELGSPRTENKFP